MLRKMRYRLALDLGTTSIGWALFRLTAEESPNAVIRSGVRIFRDGRDQQDGSSLAVTRRAARAMRRNRDRKLKRKAQLMRALVELGFFPQSESARKDLDRLDPYNLRARGLDNAMAPGEFARAVFHLNQRRGFLSNRKTDKNDNDSGALKTAIKLMRETLHAHGLRTVGEWLAKLHAERKHVRARLRELVIVKPDGKNKKDKKYDLYVDRAMVKHEFETLWKKQAELNPQLFTIAAKERLEGVMFHQRPLKPVKPGRCSLMPEEPRAPLALPSVQQFRIYQELNNLALLDNKAGETNLSLVDRDTVANELNRNAKRLFTQITKALKRGTTKYNLEDAKRDHLKGNLTAAILADDKHFGETWFDWSLARQDEIVTRLLTDEDESALVKWLCSEFDMDETRAETIANAGLPEGYGSLSAKALEKILPALKGEVISFAEACKRVGFHHSQLSHALATGEILEALPYYGEYLQRHVGFGTGDPKDSAEKRYGRIANPTVHIGLNQLRKVVNALINKYGHPSEVIVEVTRDLKLSRERKNEIQREQASRQKQNDAWKADIKDIIKSDASALDLQKMKLWVELNPGDPLNRPCPYTGEPISPTMLFSDAVEIEHILPFKRTFDDSLNNKTVSLRRANRDKADRTPYEAFGDVSTGYDYAAILQRASAMPREKAKRFAPDGYERWLKEDKDFLARALNDTAYLSRVAREYLSLVCAANKVWAIPGRLTGLLRAKLGLNDILGLRGEKNRNDHRHHAVDACVIGITDRSMLQQFARANAEARSNQVNKLVETMPEPFSKYRDHVQRAVGNIVVSHRPDHNYEDKMMEGTAYRAPHADRENRWRTRGINGVKPNDRSADSPVIGIYSTSKRHDRDTAGNMLPYKGYLGGSNYCIEIVRNEKGKWEGDVISTFAAYQIVRKKGLVGLRDAKLSASGKPLVMRLMKGDSLKLKVEARISVFTIAWVKSDGRIALYENHEANVDTRDRNRLEGFSYLVRTPGSLQRHSPKQASVSEIGQVTCTELAE